MTIESIMPVLQLALLAGKTPSLADLVRDVRTQTQTGIREGLVLTATGLVCLSQLQGTDIAVKANTMFQHHRHMLESYVREEWVDKIPPRLEPFPPTVQPKAQTN